MTNELASSSGTITIGGDLTINRIGYGAMRLTGPSAWGEPADPDTAIAVLRCAVERGINLIDTADYYGPYIANRLITEALYPYPDELVIATKVGAQRGNDKSWQPAARPVELRNAVEDNLSRLRLERLDLVHFRFADGRSMPTTDVPVAESLGAMADLQKEGKVRHVGVSCVSAKQVEEAQRIIEVTSVENLYNLTERVSQDVLDLCTREAIAFLPYFPLAIGELAKSRGLVAVIAERHGVAPAQIALAWLLSISPVTIPIPGTSNVTHLEQNIEAGSVHLEKEEIDALRHLI